MSMADYLPPEGFGDRREADRAFAGETVATMRRVQGRMMRGAIAPSGARLG